MLEGNPPCDKNCDSWAHAALQRDFWNSPPLVEDSTGDSPFKPVVIPETLKPRPEFGSP